MIEHNENHIYKIENIKNRIIQGNCISTLKAIPSESIDVIFADPPYFMQTDGVLMRTDGTKFEGVEDNWDKFIDYAEYDKFCEQWLLECKRILKKDGTIWVIGAFQNIYRIGYIMQNIGYWILNDVIWSKPNAVPNFAGTRFQNSHETLLWCSKSKKSKYTFNYKTMKFLNDSKQDKSIWDISICIGNERIKSKDGKKAHSTQKPEKLLTKVILSSTKPNDIILDPFFGTGTTGAIAKKYGRNFIGLEQEPTYTKIAKNRIENTVDISDDISNLSLEVKPPKVPMKLLIKTGYLTENQALYDKNCVEICRVDSLGNVFDNEKTLSIHKMSAKVLNKINHNGWSFFYTYYKDKFISIDKLRYLYVEEVNGL